MNAPGAAVDLRLRLGPDDRQAGYYRYVPFEVPAGAPGVTVRLAYDRSSATIDLGMFDPEGFRGWSGGERSHVTVGPAGSTPGYLTHRLQPGEWQVVLGLYALPPAGVDVTVKVTLEASPVPRVAAPEVPTRPQRRAGAPAGPGRRWVAGDLHAHTVHSDGRLSVEQLAALAVSRGLDFLAVTDHNTVSHHAELAAASRRYGITLLAGQEVTTPQGHANCFGDVGWVDFRAGTDSWLEHARSHQGILSVNHPVAPGCSWERTLGDLPDLVELWHWTWDRVSMEPIEWWRAFGECTPVGGSDFHDPSLHRLGSPTTWLEIEGDGQPGPEQLLEALRSGRVAVSADPDTPPVVHHEGRIAVSGAEGAVLAAQDGRRFPVRGDKGVFDATPGLWRLTDPEGRSLAMCLAG